MPPDTWPEGRRWCSGCQSMRSFKDVAPNASRCRPCNADTAHASAIKSKFGLDAAGYQELLQRQDGKCAICRTKPGKRLLAVDHDHKSGEVRGLLCVRCNHDLLGAAYDSLSILRAAVAYLENPPATGRWIAPEHHD
jgi:hypothetical protein